MAKFVIAGTIDCPYYVRAEMIGDKLAFNLPDFKIHKIVKTNTEWKTWLSEICEANGWKHEKSPIIWRELVDRGGKGSLIGSSNDFEEYAYGYYGITIDMESETMKLIAQENIRTKTELDKAEEERKKNIKYLKICITNACNPVCFSLIDSLISGEIFGDENISLCLLDCDTSNMEDLQLIAEIIQDMSYRLLHLNVSVTSDCKTAFEGSRFIIFLDEIEREEYEKSENWIQRNAAVFGFYGKTLSNIPTNDVLLLLAGNNYTSFNMSILNELVPNISAKNIVGISKVLENQAKSVLAEKLPSNSCSIDNVVILGNISSDNYLVELDRTLVRDFDCATVGPSTFSLPLNTICHQQQWLKKDYLKEVYLRKNIVESKLEQPAYNLAAHSISSTLNYIWNGATTKSIFSVTLISEGWYDVPKGIAFSFPVMFHLPLAYSVLEDFNISEKCRQEMDFIIKNLVKDKALFEVEDGELVSKILSFESIYTGTPETIEEVQSVETILSVLETEERAEGVDEPKTSETQLSEKPEGIEEPQIIENVQSGLELVDKGASDELIDTEGDKPPEKDALQEDDIPPENDEQ